MNEKEHKNIQSFVLKALELSDIYHFKTVISNKRGIPDIVGCTKEGTFFALEIKNKGDRPSKLQKINLACIEKSGGIAFIVSSKKYFTDKILPTILVS